MLNVSASATVSVTGIKETMKELAKLEPELAKQIKKDMKLITASVVADAKSRVPNAVLSGFARSWQGGRLTPFSGDAVRKTITTRFSNRKSTMAAFAIVMKSAGGTVLDTTGRSSSGNLARQLEARFGRASRIMWPAYEANATQLEQDLQAVVDVVQQAVNSRLVR